MEYTWRPLTSKDKKHVMAIAAECWPDIPPEDIDDSWENRDHDQSLAILDEKSTFIGFIIGSFYTSTADNLYIDYLALKPEYRGCGIADKVIRTLIKEAFLEKRSVHLYPYMGNESLINWYKKYGFYATYDGYYNFHSYSTRKQAPIHKALCG